MQGSTNSHHCLTQADRAAKAMREPAAMASTPVHEVCLFRRLHIRNQKKITCQVFPSEKFKLAQGHSLQARVFVSTRKTGYKNRFMPKNMSLFFLRNSENRNDLIRKNMVSLDPWVSPYTRKTGTQKNRAKFSKIPSSPRILDCCIMTRRTYTHQNTEVTQHNHK